MKFQQLQKLQKGDKAAIVSPSFAGPGVFPHVYELGLKRLREDFGLEPMEYPTTRKVGASAEDRSQDLIAAFEDPEIKAVISTIGGDDQITYIKHLPQEPFINNPKPFFGYSDNSHFMNHLWLSGVPSYYGGGIMTQYAMQGKMDDFTVTYLQKALFEGGEVNLTASEMYNDVGLEWADPENLTKSRVYEKNSGWYWDGKEDAEGITWGGCVESLDEMLRHGVKIPSLDDFENIVLFAETSEEMPSADYVRRVFRALGERGILARIQSVLIGRPKASGHENPKSKEEKEQYRRAQRESIVSCVRMYNATCPVVQNIDFGHTDPQICLPMGAEVAINAQEKNIKIQF